MPPKRQDRTRSSVDLSDERVAETEAEKKGGGGGDYPVSLASLQAKPCRCCGREISPRRKWARNWDSIRFCSDQCRSWQSAVVVVVVVGLRRSSAADDDRLDECTLLERCLAPTQDDGMAESESMMTTTTTTTLFYVDAWIEGTIFSVARRSNVQAKSFATLEQVSMSMHDQLSRLSDPSLADSIRTLLANSKAGERELIRRAARRLVVLPLALSAFTEMNLRGGGGGQSDDEHLVLSQQKGKRKVSSLYDVSHAKGQLEISTSTEAV